MKSIFQLFLLALIFFIGYLFYTSYFLENKNTSKKIIKNSYEKKNTETVIKSDISENSDENEIENNQIKNLLYKVSLNDSNSDESSFGGILYSYDLYMNFLEISASLIAFLQCSITSVHSITW